MKKIFIIALIVIITLAFVGTYGFIHYKIGFSDEEKIRMEPPFYRVYQNDSNAEPFPNCPDTLEPVCGVDNVTYQNRCDARWVPIDYEGWCKGAEPKSE